jgi:hypothetical protein
MIRNEGRTMSPKQQVKEVLEHLPENCSVEDVQYHLYVMERIRRRLAQCKDAEFIPHSEIEKRLAKWIVA